MKVVLAIPDTTPEEIERSVEGYLSLDLKPQQKKGRGVIKKNAAGISFTENVDPHPVEIIVHLILIVLTAGLWPKQLEDNGDITVVVYENGKEVARDTDPAYAQIIY